MRIGLAALLVVVTLVAAACNGGAAKSSPTSSATSVPVSSPTAKPSSSPAGPATTGPNVRPGERPPIMPPAAKQHTQEGALAFGTFYIKALDWAIATMDTSLVKGISAPTCQTCNGEISAISDLKEAGGHVQGGRYSVESARVSMNHLSVKADHAIRLQLVQAPLSRIYSSSSPTVESRTPVPYTSFVFVTWLRRGWVIVEQGGLR
jgi:Family of unknown function (DUF6318)